MLSTFLYLRLQKLHIISEVLAELPIKKLKGYKALDINSKSHHQRIAKTIESLWSIL